jgi:hypothetical protein
MLQGSQGLSNCLPDKTVVNTKMTMEHCWIGTGLSVNAFIQGNNVCIF